MNFHESTFTVLQPIFNHLNGPGPPLQKMAEKGKNVNIFMDFHEFGIGTFRSVNFGVHENGSQQMVFLS